MSRKKLKKKRRSMKPRQLKLVPGEHLKGVAKSPDGQTAMLITTRNRRYKMPWKAWESAVEEMNRE